LLKLNTYTYDSNNKLTQLVGPSGTTTFGYDDNGNTSSMTAPGPITTNYGYDYENRLTSVTNPSYTAAYTYSADGLRLRAQESNHPYPDRWFLYAGVLPFCEGTLSGDTYTSNKIYIREGLSYYDPLVFLTLPGVGYRYYLYDGLGSTRQLMRHSDQGVSDTYTYEAFGNSMGSTGTTANPYKYVGSLGYYGPTAAGGSSLQHLGARYYMPEVGRFVQQDPLLRTRGGSKPGLTDVPPDLYAYAANGPAGRVDPSGLRSPWEYFIPIYGPAVAVQDCVGNAYSKAERIAVGQGLDKLAHCFLTCKAARCTVSPLGPLLAKLCAEVIPGEDNPEDSQANTTGAKCAAKVWWLSCEDCCRAKLPRLGWR